MPANIHVVPDRQGGWAVAVDGRDEPISHYASQRQAVIAGTAKAKREHVELFIHRSDGSIQERNSFGNDPRNIRG